MKFHPPRLQDEDGQPGPKILAFELEGNDRAGEPIGTILVEREDYQGKEWVIWSTKLTTGVCFHGIYLHSCDGKTLEFAREMFDDRVKHYRS